MSFDESLVIRDTAGQFAGKHGAAAEISLDAPEPTSHATMMEALIRRKMTTPIALGNLADGLSDWFVEDIADYHMGYGAPEANLPGVSHADADTFAFAGKFEGGDDGLIFQKRYTAALEGETVMVGVGREIAVTGEVTATRGTEVQVDDEDVWYDLADAKNVHFARVSYDIARMESKSRAAARAITE